MTAVQIHVHIYIYIHTFIVFLSVCIYACANTPSYGRAGPDMSVPTACLSDGEGLILGSFSIAFNRLCELQSTLWTVGSYLANLAWTWYSTRELLYGPYLSLYIRSVSPRLASHIDSSSYEQSWNGYPGSRARSLNDPFCRSVRC